jgi:hypothetical protein
MHHKQIPTTYDEARETLKGRESRTIANNTTLADLGDCIGLRLHSTYVVRFYADGRISLHTGGWQTVTTKDRLNKVIRAHGWNLYAERRVWYVAHRDGRRFEFEDGFTIPPARESEPDARVENHGTLFLVRPLNEGIREHLEENVSEEARWFGGALVVEHRYVANLVSGLCDAGFRVAA